MSDRFVDFLDCANGLYKQGLDLLDPEGDDYSILSGCILLEIGFEKFIKHTLQQKNQLLILDTIKYLDVIDAENGKRIGSNRRTVNLDEALKRLSKLYPEINLEGHNVRKIIEDRNLLVHGAGYIDIAKIEGRVRVNITDLSEFVCEHCLGQHPEKLFSEKIWNMMAKYRDAYKHAEVLELKKRIAHLRRTYTKGIKLPCTQVIFSKTSEKAQYDCPICDNIAEIEISWDIDVDHREGIVMGAWPFLNALRCEECGFTLCNSNEVSNLIGENVERELLDRLYPELAGDS